MFWNSKKKKIYISMLFAQRIKLKSKSFIEGQCIFSLNHSNRFVWLFVCLRENNSILSNHQSILSSVLSVASTITVASTIAVALVDGP
jgi:hypothetical protein